mmetsp:Transcript_53459/g.116733  ORF Transcript_53459/g.116733 Transcript_53459/m.116733 type:complete len:226 (-) Transcript_53459:157-834(-)
MGASGFSGRVLASGFLAPAVGYPDDICDTGLPLSLPCPQAQGFAAFGAPASGREIERVGTGGPCLAFASAASSALDLKRSGCRCRWKKGRCTFFLFTQVRTVHLTLSERLQTLNSSSSSSMTISGFSTLFCSSLNQSGCDLSSEAKVSPAATRHFTPSAVKRLCDKCSSSSSGVFSSISASLLVAPSSSLFLNNFKIRSFGHRLQMSSTTFRVSFVRLHSEKSTS